MPVVRNRIGKQIPKNLRPALEAHPMLPQIRFGLYRVPLEMVAHLRLLLERQNHTARTQLIAVADLDLRICRGIGR
jgi:hypothetical protein